jgi:hypothetical protein
MIRRLAVLVPLGVVFIVAAERLLKEHPEWRIYAIALFVLLFGLAALLIRPRRARE